MGILPTDRTDVNLPLTSLTQADEPTVRQLMKEGRTALESGLAAEATRLFSELVERKPNSAICRYFLANALQASGRQEEAAAGYLAVLKIDATVSEAHNNLGVILQSRGLLPDAENHFRSALKYRADYLDAYLNLAACLRKQHRLQEAVALLESARRSTPRSAQLQYALGNSYRRVGNFPLAISLLEEACEMAPENPLFHNSLGIALQKGRAPHAALESFQQALALDPSFAEAQLNIGSCHRDLGQFENAIDCYEHALLIRPDYATAHYNIALLSTEMHQFEQALYHYSEAISLDPGYAAAHHNLALLLLLTGNFQEGWPEFEWRWQHLGINHCPINTSHANPSILHKQRVLIEAEQGIGDQVMFASCLPEVLDLANEVKIECDERLLSLFERSFPSALPRARQFDHAKRESEDEAFDVRIPVGSLPLLFRPTIESFKKRDGYLLPDKNRMAAWKQRLESFGITTNVGISWQGGGRPETRVQRSTQLEQWEPLFRVPNVTFIDLQYGDHKRERERAAQEYSVDIHQLHEASNLDDTCALIASLDLIVSVDNTTVHLAGALGKPVWTLLSWNSDWRWLLERSDSVWYSTMRLIRQKQPGDWGALFKQVAEELSHVANSSSQKQDASS